MTNRIESAINDEVDIGLALSPFFKNTIPIALTSLLSACLFYVHSFNIDNIYQSTVLVTPNNNDAATGANTGSLSSLASLAGIKTQQGDETEYALAVLESNKFSTYIIEKHHLKKTLYKNKWDEKANKWIRPSKLDAAKHRIKSLLNGQLINTETTNWEPSDYDAIGKFKKLFTINIDKSSGHFRIITLHNDAEFAAWLSNTLIAEVNNHIRKQKIKEYSDSISFLKQELKNTSIVGLQEVLFSLIENNTQKIMLANVQSEYVFKVIDPATPSLHPTHPKRASYFVIGCIIGLIISYLFYLRKNIKSAE